MTNQLKNDAKPTEGLKAVNDRKNAKADRKAQVHAVHQRDRYDIARINGSTLIPLDVIEERKIEKLNGLQKGDEIVLHCKAGVRSLKAAKALIDLGFENVKSMRGGIEEWAEKVDSSVPKY